VGQIHLAIWVYSTLALIGKHTPHQGERQHHHQAESGGDQWQPLNPVLSPVQIRVKAILLLLFVLLALQLRLDESLEEEHLDDDQQRLMQEIHPNDDGYGSAYQNHGMCLPKREWRRWSA